MSFNSCVQVVEVLLHDEMTGAPEDKIHTGLRFAFQTCSFEGPTAACKQKDGRKQARWRSSDGEGMGSRRTVASKHSVQIGQSLDLLAEFG